MMIYSHNVSLAEWVSVYEAYYQSAMRACDGHPTVVVQHDQLVTAPPTRPTVEACSARAQRQRVGR